MTKISEEAVTAAKAVLNRAQYVPITQVEEALTAALPFLTAWVKACDCTKIQQDETCPISYPTLLCETCDGKGILPASPPHPRLAALEDAVRNLIAVRYDTYKAKNGKLCSIEGDDGEKAWIVPFDAMADLESALAAEPATDDGEYEIDYEVICDGEYVAGSSALKEALPASGSGPIPELGSSRTGASVSAQDALRAKLNGQSKFSANTSPRNTNQSGEVLRLQSR